MWSHETDKEMEPITETIGKKGRREEDGVLAMRELLINCWKNYVLWF